MYDGDRGPHRAAGLPRHAERRDGIGVPAPSASSRRPLPPLSPAAWLRYGRIRALLRPLPIRSVLEVGAGQGALGARLACDYDYLGVEPDTRSARVAAERVATAGGRVECCALEDLDATGTFDLVCAFEVLEHLADDRAALAAWHARVRPGGWLLLSVPAWQERMGPADDRVGHYRRYAPDDLTRVLEAAAFVDVHTELYGFPLGYWLEAVRNRLAARRPADTDPTEGTAKSGRWLQPPSWAGAATMLATLPFRAVQRPFARSRRLGTGVIALARRPATGGGSAA